MSIRGWHQGRLFIHSVYGLLHAQTHQSLSTRHTIVKSSLTLTALALVPEIRFVVLTEMISPAIFDFE
jgi:hypothetical protein